VRACQSVALLSPPGCNTRPWMGCFVMYTRHHHRRPGALHVRVSSFYWQRHSPVIVYVVVMSTRHCDPHTGPGASRAAAEEGGSAVSSARSGKLSRLMSVHPRRRTSASYARAASCLVAKHPTS